MDINFDNLLIKNKYFTDDNFKKSNIKDTFSEIDFFNSNYSYPYVFFHDFFHIIDKTFKNNESIHSISFEFSLSESIGLLDSIDVIFRNSSDNIINSDDKFQESLKQIFNDFINNHFFKFTSENKKLHIKQLISKFDLEIDRESSFEIYDYLFGFLNEKIYDYEKFKHSLENKNHFVDINILGREIKFPYVMTDYNDFKKFKEQHEVFQNNLKSYYNNNYLLAYQILPFILKNKDILNSNFSIFLGKFYEQEINTKKENNTNSKIAHEEGLYIIKDDQDLTFNLDNIIFKFYSLKDSSHNIQNKLKIFNHPYHATKLTFNDDDNNLDKIKTILKDDITSEVIDDYLSFYEKNIISDNIRETNSLNLKSNKKRL